MRFHQCVCVCVCRCLSVSVGVYKLEYPQEVMVMPDCMLLREPPHVF
jgi:hypothetical protein